MRANLSITMRQVADMVAERARREGVAKVPVSPATRLLQIELAMHSLSLDMQGLEDALPEAAKYGGRMREVLDELAMEFRRLKLRLPNTEIQGKVKPIVKAA